MKKLFLISITITSQLIAGPQENEMLLKAARDHDRTMLRQALASGADVNYHDPNGAGITALILASHNDQNVPLLEDLLRSPNIQVDDVNSAGNTALMISAAQGQPRTVEKLLAAHADVNKKDAAGMTALDYLEGNWNDIPADKRDRVKQLLERAGAQKIADPAPARSISAQRIQRGPSQEELQARLHGREIRRGTSTHRRAD